ncbi:hypothetical protein EX30DRAFT_341633 [Ascodesmis nigricans]|uniref:Extracellular membrane protein CFEM domain-containing protein n=1 Tax=Ascodesmis nigricans TaxID=341454 RepID=A0A4S2MV55_9PEZI|nr:hypothetical protein EX30DRAFT_341633 [Ascodesmis nigricans]
MQLSSVLLALGVVAVASAQSSKDCDAQFIVDTCLSNIRNEPDCKTQDYQCLCDRAARSVTCWDNCPKSPDVGIQKSEETAWCNAWKQSPGYSSAVSAASAYAATALPPSATASSAADAKASGEAKEEKEEDKSAAGAVVVSSAGVFGAFVAAVGMLL